MTDIGKLSLRLLWASDVVRSTGIRSTRKFAAPLFVGKTPAQVVQLAALLFSVCGQAQAAAAKCALQAARGDISPIDEAMHKAIICEAMQEHLWRLMLDWPKLLGLPQQAQDFAKRHALLRKIARGESAISSFQQMLQQEELGITFASWGKLDNYAALQEWWRNTDSPLTRVLQKLAATVRVQQHRNVSSLVPVWTAAQAIAACAGKWSHEFARHPQHLGEAMETGAWSYYADSPLLADVWQRTRSKPLTRLVARVIDLLDMANGIDTPRLDSGSAEAGEGVAVVRTARGLLMHHVSIVDTRVAEYVIVAPTEWNFHQEGAFAQDMRGLVEKDENCLRQLAEISALSLDPCVAYEVEIDNA